MSKTFGEFIFNEIVEKLELDYVPITCDDSTYNVTGAEFDKTFSIPIVCSFCGNKMDNMAIDVLNYYVKSKESMCSNCNIIPVEISNEELIKDVEKNMNVKIIRKSEYSKLITTMNEKAIEFIKTNKNKNKSDENKQIEKEKEVIEENVEMKNDENINIEKDVEKTIDEDVNNLLFDDGDDEELLIDDNSKEVVASEQIEEESNKENIVEEDNIISDNDEDDILDNEEEISSINEEELSNEDNDIYDDASFNEDTDEMADEDIDIKEDVLEDDSIYNDDFDINDDKSDIDKYIEVLTGTIKNRNTSNKNGTIYDVIVEKATDKKGNLLGEGIDTVRFTCQECGNTFKVNSKTKYLESNHLEEVLDLLFCNISIYDTFNEIELKDNILNCPDCRDKFLVPWRSVDLENPIIGFFNKLIHYTIELYITMENELYHQNNDSSSSVIINNQYMNIKTIHDEFKVIVVNNGKKETHKTKLINYINYYKDYDMTKHLENASKYLVKKDWENMINPKIIKKHSYSIDKGFDITFYNKDSVSKNAINDPERSNKIIEDAITNEAIPSTFDQIDNSEEFEVIYNSILRELKTFTNPVLKKWLNNSLDYNSNKIFRAGKYDKQKKKITNPFSNSDMLREEFEYSMFRKFLSTLGDVNMKIKIDSSTYDIPVVDMIGSRNGGIGVRILCYDLKDIYLHQVSPFFEKKIPFAYDEYNRHSKKPYKTYVIYSDSIENGGMLGVTKAFRKILKGVDKNYKVKLSDNDYPLFYTTDNATYMAFSSKNSPNGSTYTKVSKIDGGSICILAAITGSDNRSNSEVFMDSIRHSLFQTDHRKDKLSVLKETGLYPTCGCKYYAIRNPLKKIITYYITDYIEVGTSIIEDGLDSCCSIILKEHFAQNNIDKMMMPLILVEYDKASLPSPSFERSLYSETPSGEKLFKCMNINNNDNSNDIFNMNFILRDKYKQLGINTTNHTVIKNPNSDFNDNEKSDYFRYDSRVFSSKRSLIQIFGNKLKNYNINVNDSNYNFVKSVMSNLNYLNVLIIPPITFLAKQDFINKIKKNMILFNRLDWKDNDYSIGSDSQNKFINTMQTFSMMKMLQDNSKNKLEVSKEDKERLMREFVMKRMFGNRSIFNNNNLFNSNNNMFNNLGGM